MRTNGDWYNFALVLLAFAVLLPGCSGLATREGGADCQDIAERGYINVLTLNLLFSEIRTRDHRLATLGEFVFDNQVDVILLQEVVGGALAQTDDSARDLKNILADDYDLDYNLNSVFEIAVPETLAVENAILSRCEMPFMLVKPLPWAPEIEFQGKVMELGRNVLMSRLKIPRFGRINIYNAHLCAACSVADRQEQLHNLLAFVNGMENYSSSDKPVVLGGDFNIDLFRDNGSERFLYSSILNTGFIDSYASMKSNVNKLCENPQDADKHCTVGVSDLDGSNARRVDYLFVRGFGKVLESRVAFNTAITGEPTVSNHAAVLSRLALPR